MLGRSRFESSTMRFKCASVDVQLWFETEVCGILKPAHPHSLSNCDGVQALAAASLVSRNSFYQLTISRITLPWTSVRRKSRPA